MMDLLTSILTPTNLLITVICVLAAFFLLHNSKKTQSISVKVFLIYAHIALLLVPIATAAYSTGCAMTTCTTQTLLFAMPFLIAGVLLITGIGGFFLLPRLYRKRFGVLPFTDKKLINRFTLIARQKGIRAPSVHVLDTAQPLAFSFSSWKPAIFISVGMMDILGKKEIEAVLLHELGHIVHRSSWLTFATKLTRTVSPVAFFAKLSSVQDEEIYADMFAANAQGTMRHINKARFAIDDSQP